MCFTLNGAFWPTILALFHYLEQLVSTVPPRLFRHHRRHVLAGSRRTGRRHLHPYSNHSESAIQEADCQEAVVPERCPGTSIAMLGLNAVGDITLS